MTTPNNLTSEDIAAAIQLEKFIPIVCDICGSDNTKPLANNSRFNLPLKSVICQQCGFIYFNPSMTRQQYDDFYGSFYRKLHPWRGSMEDHFKRQHQEGQEIYAFCESILQPGMKVLEIGCGTGGIVAAFHAKEINVVGVEPSEVESEYARKKGLNVETNLFENAEAKSKKFDLVILNRTLNHLYRPSEGIAGVADILNDNGYVYLKVLDFPAQCLYGSIEACAQIDHLFMFTPETVEVLLNRFGLRVVINDANGRRKFPPYRSHFGYHMQVLAQQKNTKTHLDLNRKDIPRLIQNRINANQAYFKKRRLFYGETYVHAMGSLVKKIVGPRVHKFLKNQTK